MLFVVSRFGYFSHAQTIIYECNQDLLICETEDYAFNFAIRARKK